MEPVDDVLREDGGTPAVAAGSASAGSITARASAASCATGLSPRSAHRTCGRFACSVGTPRQRAAEVC